MNSSLESEATALASQYRDVNQVPPVNSPMRDSQIVKNSIDENNSFGSKLIMSIDSENKPEKSTANKNFFGRNFLKQNSKCKIFNFVGEICYLSCCYFACSTTEN